MAASVIPPPPPGFTMVGGNVPPPPPGFKLVKPEGMVEGIARDFISGANRTYGALGDMGVAGLNAIFGLSNRIDEGTAYKRRSPIPGGGYGPFQPIGKASDAYSSLGLDLNRPRNLAGISGEFMAIPGNISQEPVKDTIRTLAAAAGARTANLAFPNNPAAEMVGAISPFGIEPAVAGLTRWAFRGNDAARMQERLANMDAAGVKPTVGSASGNKRSQALEATVAALPGGHGQIKAAGFAANDALEQDIQNLAGGVNRDRVVAGNTIKSGLFGQDGWINTTFRANRDKLYTQLEAKLTPNTPVAATNTSQLLLTANKGVQGAPALSANHFVDKEMQSLADDFFSDVNAAGGKLPYEALKKVRTKVNDKLADPELIGSEVRRDYARLRDALTADMKDAATAVGAQKEFAAANRYNQLGQQRIDDFFQGISTKVTPEEVYKVAIGDSPESATKLFKIKNSLKPEEWQVVRETVLNRMSRAKANVGTEEYTFSAETFLTNYNNMSKNPRVLDALFGSPKSSYRQNLDLIAKNASYLRESSKVLANPSGSAGLGLQGSVLFGALGGATNLAIGAATGATAGAALPGVVTGVAGGTIASYGLGKLLTNEPFVRWLAQGTKIPMKTLPAHLARLTIIANNNPDFAPLIEEYKAKVEADLASR